MKYRVIFSIMLASVILSLIMAPYVNAETGIIEIIDVYWGESGREWAAMPGDRANLIVDFRSLIEDETICGLKVILWPIDPFRPFPFSSIKPGNITAYTDQQINFGDKAQIIFDVVIDKNAKPGVYEAYLYFFYYDCSDPEYPLIMTLKQININVWPLPNFRIIDVSWLNNEGLQTSVGPGDSNKILSITFAVPKYYEVSNIASILYLNDYFTNLTGGNIVKTSYAGKSSEDQYFTLRFPLNVKSTAALGTYDLKLVLNYYDKWLTLQTQEVHIPVTLAGSSDLEISTEPLSLTAGYTSNLNVRITNIGSSPLYSAKISISSDNLVVLGSSEVRISEVKPGKYLDYSFLIHAPATLSENFYPVVIQAQYVDSDGAVQTLSKTVKIEVKSQPQLSLSSYVKNPEVIVGGSYQLSIVLENPYDSSVTDATVKMSFENIPLAVTNGGILYFQEIPARGSVELKIPVKVSPSASTGISYGKLSVTYRDPSGLMRTDEFSIPIIVKPDLKLDFGQITLSSTSVMPGESIDISGDVYNRGLSTGKLCEVKVNASSPLITTSDSEYYIGDISGLSKASFSASIDVANNAKPGKYIAYLVASCSDTFGEISEYSKVLEIEITQRQTPIFTTRTEQRQTTTSGSSFLLNPIIILSVIGAAIVVAILFLLKRRKKRETP